MRRWWLAAGLAAAVTVGLYFLLFSGPRMLVQAHLKAFQARRPLPPPGAVPATAPWPAAASAPTDFSAADLLARGRIYYAYYCQACHGAKGDGHGPVGESYVPAPSDLRTARLRGLNDDQLLRAMLQGVGHEPVLERTVWPSHRPALVAYVRALAGPAPASAPESRHAR